MMLTNYFAIVHFHAKVKFTCLLSIFMENTNNYHKIASQTQNWGDNDYAEREDFGVKRLFGTS